MTASEAGSATDVERLEQTVARQNHLLEASYALHTTLDLDELLGLILKAAANGVDAERGTVFLLSQDGSEIWSKVLQGEENLEIRLPVGQGIAGTVAETGETIRIADAHADARFDASWDKKTGFVTRQMLAAPIRGRDGTIVGVFQLLNKREGEFGDPDVAFLEALSVHAALAVENARLHRSAIEQERQEREILLAQDVQRAFQPERRVLTLGGLAAAGMNELCEDASGDYYDFIELTDGRLAVVVGDVSGHGLGSSLVMAQARAFLLAFCRTVERLQDTMNMLNDFLARDMLGGKFMCMFLGIIDPETGRMEWCNAGHPPAILLRAGSGTVEQLGATGTVLGIFEGSTYETGAETVLESGDALLVYTDGATEACDPAGEMFLEPRLTRLFEAKAPEGPEAVLDGVRGALLDWTKQPRLGDDLTMLVVQRTGSA